MTIEIIVNPFLPPDMIVAMPSNLTDEEKRAIRRAKDEARAAGKDEAAIALAGWEVLIKTGKVAVLHCGKNAEAKIAAQFSPGPTMPAMTTTPDDQPPKETTPPPETKPKETTPEPETKAPPSDD